MSSDPAAPPKCLREVEGRTLLDRLLPTDPAAVERCRILVPPGNEHFAKWEAGYSGPVPCELIEAPLEPFGRTVLRAAGQAREVVVSDSDLVLADGAVDRFVAAAGRSTAALTLGLTTEPWDLGPRTIWWSDGRRAPRVGRHLPHPRARLAGLYCLREPALDLLREHVAAGRRSFAVFLSSLPAAAIDGVPVGFAFNCNSPDDLAAARARVGTAEG